MVTRRVSESEPSPDPSSGFLRRLWAEFNDPGPGGDTLVMLKKYGDGILPGCMGLVFLGAGLTMMTLFFRLATTADKKTWLPILFGFVFAAAGFGVLKLGLGMIRRKSLGSVQRS